MSDFRKLEQRALAEERPCVSLLAASARGNSYLGGLPGLPPELEWPALDAAPLPFLAQIDLGGIPNQTHPDWMPYAGSLLFFHDHDRWGFDPNQRTWSVLHVPDDPSNTVRVPPSSLRREKRYARKNVHLATSRSVPSYERLKREIGELSNAEFEKMLDFYEAFDEPHKMFGWPDPSQDDEMELECELASNGKFGWDRPSDSASQLNAIDWQLLLQLSSDDESGMMWGDGGTLYFWVRTQDAARRDFSNVWMVAQ